MFVLMSVPYRSPRQLDCAVPARRTGKIDTNSLGILGEVGVLVAWISSFPLQREAESWNDFFHSLCAEQVVGSMASASPSHYVCVTDLCCTCQNSKAIKTEAISVWRPLRKLGMLDACTNPFHSLGEGVSSWSYGALPATRTPVRGYPKFLYWLQWVWFYNLLRCRSLSVSFWISHKGNFSVNCCWISMFVGARGVQRSPPCPLANVALCFLVTVSLGVLCALG